MVLLNEFFVGLFFIFKIIKKHWDHVLLCFIGQDTSAQIPVAKGDDQVKATNVSCLKYPFKQNYNLVINDSFGLSSLENAM